MNQVDIVNSDRIEVFGSKQLPMVGLESSKECKIHLNNATRNCKVQTCCCRSVFVRFPKVGTSDEDQSDLKNIVQIPVAEMFETIIHGDEAKTEVLEACE